MFEATSRYDAGIGRSRKITRYIGWITEGGIMVPARHRQPKPQDVARAIAREEAVQKISLEEASEAIEAQKAAVGRHENAILMNLSMNGRIGYKAVGERIGLSPSATKYQISRLEHKYGIKYTAELDLARLGYTEFVVLIKFDKEIPTVTEMREAFEGQPIVQLCATLKGNYDLMLYIVVETDLRKAVYERVDALRTGSLTKYPAVWEIKLVYTLYGLMPLREIFFDKILRDKVWQRTKDRPRPAAGEIFYRDYVTMRELSRNGAGKFSSIDLKHGLNKGSAQHSYLKLRKSGMLRRITINVTALPVLYNGLILMVRKDVKEAERTRNDWRSNVVAYTEHPINKYTMLGDIVNPDGVFALVPVFKGDSVEAITSRISQTVRGFEFETFMITSIILGEFCYRRFDNDYSPHFENLVRNKAVPQRQLTQY
ncbi:MAG: hypothetical protein KGH66_01945 [Candidatus Micrarchaeota archaeon]|nr:hypothetical protein [Candidatus Micrarchaeota archaeon]